MRKVLIIVLIVSLLLNVKLALAKEAWIISLVKSEPKGKIINSQNMAVFEDENVRISCIVEDVFKDKKICPKVTIINLSNEVLIIDWDKASFIDMGKKIHRIVYDGISPKEVIKEIPPVTLAPSSQFKAVLIPVDLVEHNLTNWMTSSLSDNRSQLSEILHYNFTIVLPIKKRDQTIYYTLDYQIIALQEFSSLERKRIRVGTDSIFLGYYLSTGENGEPDLLAGLSLSMFAFPGVSFRKYFKIAGEAFLYGELGVALILPYVGVGAVYANQSGFEAGLGINLYPGADDYGNFLVLPFPNFILSVRF